MTDQYKSSNYIPNRAIEKKGVFTSIKNAIVRSLSGGSCSRERIKCCGKKRNHLEAYA